MPFTATISRNISGVIGNVFTSNISADANLSLNIPVPDGATDQSVGGVDVKIAEVKFMYLISTTDLTLKTNSSSVPDETLNLLAGVPYIFPNGGNYLANLFATDLTGLFLTNGSGSDATFSLEIIYDPAP